jgi:hypothetical protein
LAFAKTLCETGNGPEGIIGLGFGLSGDLSGSYAAAGTPVLGGDGQPEFGSWAIAAEADSHGGTKRCALSTLPLSLNKNPKRAEV